MEITSSLINVRGEGTPYNRANHAACTSHDSGTIWLYGGECTSSSRAYSDLWSYCPVRDAWRQHKLEGANPGKLTGCSMAASSTGIFIFGGVIFDQPGVVPLWFLPKPDHQAEYVRVERVSTFGEAPSNMQHASLIVQTHHGIEYLYIFGGFRALVGAQKSAYRLNLAERRWEELPSGPEARYKSACCAYQSNILIVGGLGTTATEYGDVWGFNTAVKQWTCWAKQLPRCLNGFCFVKNEILYIIGEARKSNYVTINGYDLLERKLYSFYHKLPEMTSFVTCMLGTRDITRKRTNSAPNLLSSRSSSRSSPKSSRNLVTPAGLLGPAAHVDDEGVSLNEVRDQLHKIASVRYDAQSKSVIFNSQSAPRKEVELGQGDSSLSDETSFMRMSEDYRSVRSDGDERRQKTPIKQYRGYQGPKCLLIIGGKPTKPAFKREAIKVFRVDL